MRSEIEVAFRIESAHRLPGVRPSHPCARLHGHGFVITVRVEGPVGYATGWVMDFADVKYAFEPLHDVLDHNYLNEVPGLDNPTSENLARWVFERMRKEIPQVSSVSVSETCTSSCTYRGEGS